MKTPDIRRIIKRVDDLPTLPLTVLRITELVNNPKSSARDLARVITGDQVLTARLLKLVNSAFYGFPQRISTVAGAIVLLGFDAIRNLLLTTSLFDFFSQGNRATYPISREQLWDHSLGCAVGAKVIGHFIRYEKVEELFVAGLLHDIGKIVEMLFMPEEFSRITDLAETEHTLLVAAEREVLGFTHAQVGQLLTERWNLPVKLGRVIACHHDPEQAGPYMLETSVVHFADILCRALDRGSGGDRQMPGLDTKAWDTLGLQRGDIASLMETLEAEFVDISPFTTH